jgi:hypothetical protein
MRAYLVISFMFKLYGALFSPEKISFDDDNDDILTSPWFNCRAQGSKERI